MMSQFTRLEVDLIYQVLNKMDAVPLVRMRQTCQCVDSVAEKFQKKLAKRPSFGTNLVLQYIKGDLYFGSVPFANELVKVVKGEYEKHLSGISFKMIAVCIDGGYPQAIEFLERLQPKCEKLHLSQCKLEFIGPLTNSIICEEEIDLTNAIAKLNQYEVQEAFAKLSKVKNCSKFRIAWKQSIEEEIFEKVKHFSSVDIQTEEGFDDLLWDIYNSKEEKIVLNSIRLKITAWGEIVFRLRYETEELPPFEMVPNAWEKYEKYCSLRLMALPSQYVLIVVDDVNEDYESMVTIHFLEKSEFALKNKLKSIHPYFPKVVREQEFPALSTLPNKLIFAILNKMTVNELIRMRKTCSKMDSVAEEHRKELASRTSLGVSLCIGADTIARKKTLCFAIRGESWAKMKVAVDRVNEKTFSGISFSEIEYDDEDDEFCAEMITFLQRFKPRCKTFSRSRFPLALMGPLMESITFENTLKMNDTLTDFYRHDAEKVVSTLNKVKNCSKFFIDYNPREKGTLEEDVWEKTKFFNRISVYTNVKAFHQLIWNIHNTKEKITMDSISVFIPADSNVFETLLLPSFHFLQEPALPDAEKSFYRLMVLPSQFAFISTSDYGNKMEVTIYFTEEKSVSSVEDKIISISYSRYYNKYSFDKDTCRKLVRSAMSSIPF